MHEFSLLKDLMAKVTALAQENDARRVAVVQIKLGALAHISAEHLREHFVAASIGTAAEGAVLEVEESNDTADPQAQDILLQSVELEIPEGSD